MDRRAIGVFDSGLGGLTAVRELRRCLPGEDIVYFGDTGRVPYGSRGRETIRKYAQQDSRFLLGKDVKLIIAACGTVSSVAGGVLAGLPVPAIGVVEPAAKAAIAATGNRRVGVIGTAATVRSGAFQARLEAAGCAVFTQACPLLVSLVEAGWTDPEDPAVSLTLSRYLTPLTEQGIDTLILGCTHFPLLAPAIRRAVGEEVTLIDTGREAALACRSLLQEEALLSDKTVGGTVRFFVSDRPEGFSAAADMFLGEACQDIRQVDIDTL